MKLLMSFMLALGMISSTYAGESRADSASAADSSYKELNWKEPAKELLEQQYYPQDSTADAVVVQKEMRFNFDIPYLNVISRKRIKIYSERGLAYAQFKEIYDSRSEITSIEATCYDPSGAKTELARDDIHDEILVKNQKSGWKMGSKSFAIPKVTPGCVIDVAIKMTYSGVLNPPVFRFQEEIPVEMARFYMTPPLFLHYTYSFTNDELINPKVYYNDHDFVCDARDIPAIEDETYRLPTRNMSTDLLVSLKEFKADLFKMKFSDSWQTLLSFYSKDFDRAFENSKQAKKLADSLTTVTQDTRERIRLAYNLVRDRWGDRQLFYVSGPSDDVNGLMKEKELNPEDKATVLWAILKHMGIESEVIWVCSDDSKYTALPEVPSLGQFDEALTFVPAESLFLDPGDPGSQMGVMDEANWGRLMCRPMVKDNFTDTTPQFDKISGAMIDIKLSLGDDKIFAGHATITFVNQMAIEARRKFKNNGVAEKKAFLNRMLFKGEKEAVDSIFLAPDSIQTPEQFQVSCSLKLKNLLENDAPDFELAAYPGPTFENTILDLKPPRKYPIYFGSKQRTVYTIEWNFGEQYRPLNTEGLNLAVDGTLQSYTLLTEYDQTSNRLTVRRQLNRPQKLFRPDFAPAFEKFLQNVQKCDLSTVVMVKK